MEFAKAILDLIVAAIAFILSAILWIVCRVLSLILYVMSLTLGAASVLLGGIGKLTHLQFLSFLRIFSANILHILLLIIYCQTYP